jgi:DNA-binding NtrC family response regulator
MVFNGQEALDRIEFDETVDVIVMDIAMPGINGIDALREIKKRQPLIEIIMLTGHATVQNAIEAIKYGAFNYLMKPCELDELIEKVNAAAGRKKERENKILEIRMEPYITVQERNERISKILQS